MFETRNAVFRQGHFYDDASHQRIELNEGTQVCLVAQEGGFRERQPVGLKPERYRNGEEMAAAVEGQNGFRKAWLLAKAGTTLYFGLDRKKHLFEVLLHENLYLYNCRQWKDETDLYLFDCACEVVANPNNSLASFEPVFGTSISDLHKSAYVHYLQNKGNASRNAVTIFYRAASLEPETKLEKDKIAIQQEFIAQLPAIKKAEEAAQRGFNG